MIRRGRTVEGDSWQEGASPLQIKMPRELAAAKTLGLRIRIIVRFHSQWRSVDGSDATPPGAWRCCCKHDGASATRLPFGLPHHLTILMELTVPIIV